MLSVVGPPGNTLQGLELRHPDSDLMIDLGAVFTTVDARGRFFRRIDYRKTVPAFPREADLAWFQSLLANRETPSTGG